MISGDTIGGTAVGMEGTGGMVNPAASMAHSGVGAGAGLPSAANTSAVGAGEAAAAQAAVATPASAPPPAPTDDSMEVVDAGGGVIDV